jgi:glycosyltransferase involved in cell wall biosynthesis
MIRLLINSRSLILSIRVHWINKAVLQNILINNEKKIILFYPTYDWKIPLHQRPQHFATEFAKAGYLVFFCTQNFYDDVVGYEEIESGLYITNQYKTLLRHADVVIGYATDPNFSLRSLKKILKNVDCFVYDYLDEMHADLNGKETKELKARHAEAIAHPKTIVSVSARSLAMKVRELYPQSDVIYLPNACNYQHFENSHKNETEQLTIGYFGAIASWFDFELILKLAEEFKECRVRLIGQDYDGSLSKYDLLSPTNIDLLPPIDYQKLPKEAKFDIGILPFRINKITLATSPIKIFEYLAMGLPVVSVDLPTPVGASITPISPLASPPFKRLSIPGIPIGIGCL